MSNKQAYPTNAVDNVIFTVKDNQLQALLIKRSKLPFKDQWSLVGGIIDIKKDKSLEETAKRKLLEKTGVKTPYLEQVETIGNAKRDPRGWSMTTVYFSLIPHEKVQLQAHSGASDCQWFVIENSKVQETLAFDHATILKNAIERLKSKVLYTSLPIYLLPKMFTLSELQKIYEIILDRPVQHKGFRRRILNADIIAETGELRHNGSRPAILYQLKGNQAPHYFERSMQAS